VKVKRKKTRSDLRGSRITFISIMLGSVLLVLLFGGTLAFALLGLCVIAFAYAIVHVIAAALCVKIQQRLDPRDIQRGASVEWAFAVFNKGPFPLPWVQIVTAPYAELGEISGKYNVSVLPFSSHIHKQSIVFPHRGEYTLSAKSMGISDPFRLLRISRRLTQDMRVTVWPRLHTLTRFSLSRLSEKERPRLTALDSDETLPETRPYIPGDSMARIHWKLTARRRELTTRLLARESKLRVLCVLDLRPFLALDPLTCQDTVIEAALAASRFALTCGAELTFTCDTGQVPITLTAYEAAGFDRIHHLCATAAFDSTVSPSVLIASASNSQIAAGAHYVMVFTCQNTDDEFFDALPQGAYADIFRVRREPGENLPLSDNQGHVRMFPLDPNGDLVAGMEGRNES
jgi:uncharacterized protein (DUF58 family)